MNKPILKEKECSVLIAEYSTGIICNQDLTRFLNGHKKSEIFQIFESFQTAKGFVLDFVKANPKFECIIFNHEGVMLKTFDLNGERGFKDVTYS